MDEVRVSDLQWLPFTGTSGTPQQVVNGSFYYKDGGGFRRIGPTAAVTQLDVGDATNWQLAAGSPDVRAGYLNSRIAYVEGNSANLLSGRLGDPDRPFQTMQLADDAGADFIYMRPGGNGVDAFGRKAYLQGTTIRNAKAVFCHPGVVLTGGIGRGNFQGAVPYRFHWFGGTLSDGASLNTLRQQTGPSYSRISCVRFEGSSFFQAFTPCPFDTYTDEVLMEYCSGKVENTTGLVLLTGNENGTGQRTVLTLSHCDFETVGIPTAKITPHSADPALASKLIVRATTRLYSNTGPDIRVVPMNNGTVPTAAVLVDERTSGGSYTPANDSIVEAMLAPAVRTKLNAVGGGGAPASPVTTDTLFFCEADTAGGGLAKNKVTGGPDLRVTNGSPLRVSTNTLNGYPVVASNNTGSSMPDPYVFGYANDSPPSAYSERPGTVTMVVRSLADPSTYAADPPMGLTLLETQNDFLIVNWTYATQNSHWAPRLPIGTAWTVISVHFTGQQRVLVYVGGSYYAGYDATTFDKLFGSADGGFFKLFQNFQGECAVFLVSQDPSRTAGRLHENYSLAKYAL